ncbi:MULTISPECIES: hypothetical protein [Clostridium]|uniref:hypothetical protein n=2 Tax=Clostridium TaxID=1485 RepID=UPI0006C70574|nr:MULTISPECIES: hypothetical protein [Clostridium]CUO75123.1 Uncharacterised protein [Clostridium disporicum]
MMNKQVWLYITSFISIVAIFFILYYSNINSWLLLIASIFLAVLVYSIKEISNEKKKKR